MANQDQTINFIFNAINNISGQLDAIGKSFEGVSDKADKTSKTASGGLDDIGDRLKSLQGLPGPLGREIGNLSGVFDTVQGAGSAAGAAISTGMGAALTAVAAVGAIVAAVVAALALLIKAGDESIDAFAGWANVVNDIQDVTGATAEMASTLATVGEITGVGAEAMGNMFGTLARNTEAAQNALDDYNEKVSDTWNKTSQDIINLSQESAGRQVEIYTTATDKIEEVQASLADKLDEINANQVDKERDVQASLIEMQANTAQQLEDLARSHAEKLASISESRDDLSSSYEDSKVDRQQTLQERMADIERSMEDANASYADRIAATKDAQTALRLENEYRRYIDAQYAKRDALVKEAAEEDAKAEADYKKRLARLQKQVDEENAEYARQTQRLQEEEAKREAVTLARFAAEVKASDQANNKAVLASYAATAKIAADRDKAIAEDDAKTAAQITKMKQSLEDLRAAGPQNGLIDALAKMNIKFEDWIKLPFDERVAALVKGFGGVQDQSTKTALEMALFGRSGRDLNDVLEYLGNNGIDGAKQKAKEYGLMMSEDDVKAGKALIISQGEVKSALDGVKVAIGRDLIPVKQELINKEKEYIQTWGPQLKNSFSDMSQIVVPNLVIAINDLFTSLQKISNWVRDNTGNIVGSLNDIMRTANDIFKITPSGFIASLGTSWLSGRAGGGPVLGGTPYIVGERGPELFIPSGNGTIVPNVTNYNYNASYQQPPGNEPQASFAIMKALAGV